jgi:hypothetical protein
MALSDHQSVALALTDPKGVGSISPDPLGAGFTSLDPLDTNLAMSDPSRKGSALSDPRGAGSVPPNSLERISPRPTQGLQSQPWAGARAPTRVPATPTARNTGCGPRTVPLMLGRGRTRLDVTDGLHRLYLGTHVPNSAR